MPTETARKSLRELASDLADVVRDPTRAIPMRLGALLALVFVGSPVAFIVLIVIAALMYQIREQGRACAEESVKSAEERKFIADRHEKQIDMLEQRRELREERNAERVENQLKLLTAAMERNTEAVTGKRFIQNPQKSTIPKKDDKKEGQN